MQCATTVGVVVEHVIASAVYDCNGIAIGMIVAKEGLLVTVVGLYGLASHAKETLSVVGTGLILSKVGIDLLEDLIVLIEGSGDELSVLKVYLILLIIAVVGKLSITKYGNGSGLCGIVCDLCRPYFIGLSKRNIVKHLGMDACVVSLHGGIGCTVAALALILAQGLAYGLP